MKGTNTVDRPYQVRLPDFGVSAFTSRHGPRFRMAVSRHPFHKIAFVVVGHGLLHLDSGPVELVPRSVVRVPANLPHRFEDAPQVPMTLAVVCVTPAAARALPGGLWIEAERLLPSHAAVQLGAADTAMARQAVRQLSIESATPGPYTAAVVTGQLTTLLARLLDAAARRRPGPPVRAGLAESLHWLDTHFTQPVTIPDLAARAGMSYRAYTAAFKSQTRTTVVRYVAAKRLQLADRLIRQTGDILTSSTEAGFNDLSHFYRSFRRHFGRTPAQRLPEATPNQ